MLDLSNDQAAGLRRILGARKSRYVSVLTALEPAQKNLVLLNLAAALVRAGNEVQLLDASLNADGIASCAAQATCGVRMKLGSVSSDMNGWSAGGGSVVTVREEFLAAEPDTARAIRTALVDCRAEGAGRMPEICDRVSRRIPMDCQECSSYLHGLEYDLSPVKLKALELYFQYLVDRGEVPAAAVPVKIFR